MKMKRMLMIMVALLAMVSFASGAIAQTPAKTAPAPAAPAPAPEKSKMEKPKETKAMRFGGEVVAYEAGKTIKVKGAKQKEMTFDVTADTKTKGEIKEGAKVTVMYKKEMDKMVATSISVAPPAKTKAAAPKKEMKEEKKM